MNARRWLWLLLIVLLGITLPGTLRIGITPDNRVFFSDHDPYFQQLNDFEANFTPNMRVAFVITCEKPIEECPELVASVDALTNEAQTLPFVTGVDSLSSYPTLVSTEDQVASASTLEHVCPEGRCIQERLSILADPSLKGRYIDKTRKTLSVIASLNVPTNSVDAVGRSHEASTLLMDAQKAQWQDLNIRYVGTVPLMQAFVEATNRDLTSTLGFAIFVILLVLVLCLQSIRLVAVMLCLGMATIGVTLGIAGWAGLVLNTATATIPLVLFTLIIASSMHMFMYLVRALSEQVNWTNVEAASAALNSQVKPVLLTTGTTAACLLSLMAVDSPPVRDIGLWTAIGMVIGTFLLLIYVPLYAASVKRTKESQWQSSLQLKLNEYARFVERDSVSFLPVLLALVVSVFLLMRLDVDDDFVRYFDEENAFRADTEFVASRLFGTNNLEIQIDSGESEGVFEGDFVAHLSTLTNHLRNHPLVNNVASFSEIIHTSNEHFGDGPTTLEDGDSIAQLFMAYELSLEQGQSTTDFADSDRRLARVSLSLKDSTSKDVVSLEDDIYEWNELRGSPYEIVVTGESLPTAHISKRNITAMIISIALTFLFTSMVLALFFRNIRIGVVALVTTVVPVVIGFGVWSIGADTIGLAATVILSVCIGVVIDDSIHLIFSHTEGIDYHQLDRKHAAAYSVHRVGPAIVTTTLVLVAGFVVLSFSDFQLNATFGACSAIILLSALLFDLIFSPRLLVWASPEETHSRSQSMQ